MWETTGISHDKKYESDNSCHLFPASSLDPPVRISEAPVATTPGSDAPSIGSRATEATGVVYVHVSPSASCFITNMEPLRCWLGGKDCDSVSLPTLSLCWAGSLQ